MIRLMSAKVILGGLGLTLFAKAAMSFPELPMFNNTDPIDNPAVVQIAEEKKPGPEAADDVPPLVENLPMEKADPGMPEDLLRSLNRERELVDMEQEELDVRRAEIALAQERLLLERQSLQELKGEIEALLANVESRQTDDLNRLIEFYKNMKPADAARIMDDMDIETTIMILGTMKPRSAAPIMAKVSPVRARAISKIILERSQLPGDQDLSGIRLN